MRRLQSLFLILVALWLPLQAAAAWTMPLCRHAAAREAAQQMAAAAEHAHCHEPAAAPADQPQAAADLGCDDCAICHLTSAGYLLAATAAPPVLSLRDVQAAPAPLAPPSFIGEPPQQPPRRI